MAPICTIAGSNTGLAENDDISLAPDGTLYVGNFSGNPVKVFVLGACGNVAPIRTIAGSNTTLGLVDGLGVDAAGTLYADNTDSASIAVFAPGANGNVAPIRTIAGSNTGLSSPDDIVVGFGGDLYVSDSNNSVQVFAPGRAGTPLHSAVSLDPTPGSPTPTTWPSTQQEASMSRTSVPICTVASVPVPTATWHRRPPSPVP